MNWSRFYTILAAFIHWGEESVMALAGFVTILVSDQERTVW